jgi:hypothetical protein
MKQVLSRAGRALWLGGPLLALLAVPLTGCGDGDSLVPSESPLPPGDSTPPQDTTPPPPTDSVPPPPPPDTTTPPPPDTTTPPPPDTTQPPTTSLCGPPGGSSERVDNSGLAFGPNHVPRKEFGSRFSGSQINAKVVEGQNCLLLDLAAARRANMRVIISFTGAERHLRDAGGFSLTKWKQRVDRFRQPDITPYIEDGTIVGHLIMDEPADPSNWGGKSVTHAQVEEIARYSKQVWPSLPVVIRAWPDYLRGLNLKDVDAVWIHYLHRRGPIDEFIGTNLREIRALGLNIVGGLNVLNGGSPSSNIPGKRQGLKGMSADELRTWGARWLAEPNMCAFLLWQYSESYFARPDIKAAIQDLAAQARAYPKRSCKKG